MRYVNAKEAIKLFNKYKDIVGEGKTVCVDYIIDAVIRIIGTMEDDINIVKCKDCVYYVRGECMFNKKTLPVIKNENDYCMNGNAK